MVGAAVVTEVNATSGASHGNATVAVAEYAFDVHPVEIVPHGNRAVREPLEGTMPGTHTIRVPVSLLLLGPCVGAYAHILHARVARL